MTDEDLERTYNEAFKTVPYGAGPFPGFVAGLRAVAASARKEALEEAAGVCDTRGVQFFSESPFAAECHGLAAAIRERATQPD